MTRVKICIAILLSMIVFCIISMVVMKNTCNKLSYTVSEIQPLFEEKKITNALYKADEMNQIWEKSNKILHMFIRSEKLIDLNSSFSKIKPMLEQESEDLAIEIQSILSRLEWMLETEYPYLPNIL